MKKVLITILILGVLGAGYWLASPLWRVVKVSEDAPAELSVVTSGTFTGFDAVHTGSGTAKLITVNGKRYIRFEEDFTVQNGPDLFVGLGKNGEYIKGSDIARLKGTVGSQNYEVPEGVDVEEVWIWCKAFSVPFAKAVLKEV